MPRRMLDFGVPRRALQGAFAAEYCAYFARTERRRDFAAPERQRAVYALQAPGEGS